MISKVLIVGGGVGGMSAALALSRRGAQVELIDKDPQWRAYGAGISVTGLSLRAFDDLGILDEIRQRGYVHAGLCLRTVNGQVLMQAPVPPNPAPIQCSGGIMRPVLHDILQQRVRAAGIQIRLGLEPRDFAEDAAHITVTLSDGSNGRYDLVVAADGIFSQTRARLFPEAPSPKFTGQGCWRIVADRPAEVTGAEIFVGGPVKLGFNPVSHDKMYAFILEHVPGNPRFAPEEQLGHVARLLEPFGGYVSQVRANLGEASLINYRPLESVLLRTPWHKGRIVLIGDAAHATTPHLASGAGLAAEDGLALAEEMAAANDVEQALHAFMARRFERVRMVVENSLRIGEIEMQGGNQMDANAMLGDTMHKLQQPY
jgi:2-polyprenyl-6-methoxyphenol hydroxylase-like FAD-dependent oxidoreductase